MSFCVHAGYANLFKHHLVLVKSSPTRYWFKCSHEGCTMGRVAWKQSYWKGQRYTDTPLTRFWRWQPLNPGRQLHISGGIQEMAGWRKGIEQ